MDGDAGAVVPGRFDLIDDRHREVRVRQYADGSLLTLIEAARGWTKDNLPALLRAREAHDSARRLLR